MTFRDEIEDRLTPTLRRDLERQSPRLYGKARRRVLLDMEPYESDLERQLPRLYGKARRRALLDMEPYESDLASRLPTSCPYTLGDILGEPATIPASAFSPER